MSQPSVQGQKEAKYTKKREGHKWMHLQGLKTSSGSGKEIGNHSKPYNGILRKNRAGPMSRSKERWKALCLGEPNEGERALAFPLPAGVCKACLCHLSSTRIERVLRNVVLATDLMNGKVCSHHCSFSPMPCEVRRWEDRQGPAQAPRPGTVPLSRVSSLAPNACSHFSFIYLCF